MCEDYIKVLKPAIQTLSIKRPMNETLEVLMERDFTLISQREAYEVLRFILSACGQLEKLNDKSFSDTRWKSTDPENKKRIEKCKNYVFDAVKMISKENKVPIPPLKKSDLLVPHRAIFYSCCVSLSSYALSHQFRQYGIYFWPRNAQLSHIEKSVLLSNIQEEEENKSFEVLKTNLLIEIEALNNTILEVKSKKKQVDFLLSNEIDKCNYKNLTSNFIEEPSEKRNDIIVGWKCEVDIIHKKSLQRIKALEVLNDQLSYLNRLMVRKDGLVINGEEILKAVSPEVKNVAESNGLLLSVDNKLKLPSLFETVKLSIPKDIKNEIIKELLRIKPPEIDLELLKKLELRKSKLEEKIGGFHKRLGENAVIEAMHFIKEFLFTIPKVKFQTRNSLNTPRDPIFAGLFVIQGI